MLALVDNTRVSIGNCYTPSGEEYIGVKVSILEATHPDNIKRTYDDIEAIFRANPTRYTVHEERRQDGTFKSYVIET